MIDRTWLESIWCRSCALPLRCQASSTSTRICREMLIGGMRRSVALRQLARFRPFEGLNEISDITRLRRRSDDRGPWS